MNITGKLFVTVVALLVLNTAQAKKAVWTFLPQTKTSITITSSGVATVQYTVTNQSRKTHTLVMTPIKGVTQVITNDNCPKHFTLAYHQSCLLTLRITGRNLNRDIVGGPNVCEQQNPLECYQPSSDDILNVKLVAEPGNTILSSSVSTLALQTNGVPRIITITNRGNESAFNVTYKTSSAFRAAALPTGTTITPTRCGTIAPGGKCTLRINPGASPSAAPGNTNPTPITLTIEGDNTNSLKPTINILTYGSVYQSGFLFAIDDSTPNSGSIGGKVAALVDQSFPMSGIIWSSNGNGGTTGDAALDIIPGILETSVNPPSACNGAIEGACNSNVIITYYSPPQTNLAVNLSYYAAGLCEATIGGYSDWYLPAICEMGYDAFSTGSGCGSQANPRLQNMQSNLVENNVGNLFGVYWSSTEGSINPAGAAWAQLFLIGGTTQDRDDKFEQRGVRCVRALT
ncbi:DUF1566 domain-containing protein [Legionella jamestowniensis]|uniref:NHL repeat protein n=1 Tax=Legionella jamestowniensis TaxID=455 RepID=A0A0W0UKC5_9GAMM|nr:DUF1566 domain-containing protein [Legionella jamestowniensis]KTD08261.1 NHL repeat protein [Legionella jamestowniensis]SFL97715.1 Protein of unknown function [Legionella jamestowniensis DSM 19215]